MATDIQFSPEIQSSIHTLWNYLSISNPLKKSDAIFIFGEESTSPAIKAAQLYKNEIAPYIFFSSKGGTFRNPNWDEDEAVIYNRQLLALGVPETAQCWVAETTNTLEESELAIPMMRRFGIDPQRIVIVALPPHQRRAWATIQKLNPTIEFINAPCDYLLTINQATLDRIAAEMARLERYGKKGDLLPQEFGGEISIAWQTIFPHVREWR